MKKTFLFVLISLFSLFAFSQKLAYWPEIGSNVSRHHSTELNGVTYKLGPSAGIGLQYKFSDMFSVKGRILFSKKHKYFKTIETGQLDTAFVNELNNYDWIENVDYDTVMTSLISDFINLDYTNTTEFNATLDYLEIPVYLTFTPQKNIEISAGIYGGFLLNAYTKEKMTQDIPAIDAISIVNEIPFLPLLLKGMFSGHIGPDVSSNSSTTYYNSFDYGVSAGLSYKTEVLHINIYANYGLNDITNYFKNTDNKQFIIEPNRHFNLQLSLGFYFERLKISIKPSFTKI